MSQPSSTYNSLIQLGLPASVPDNLTNPEIVSAYKILSSGILNLLRAFEQYGGVTAKDVTEWDYLSPDDTILVSNLYRLYVKASENLNYYDFVNFHNVAGVLNVRKATSYDGAAPRRAHGFCNIAGGVLSGNKTEVIVKTGIIPITGILPGQEIYLSTTAGVASLTPDTTAGHLEQHLGTGIASDLAFIDISTGTFIQH